ncbi:MAG TPA: hydrogenase nickel incorporation protein HypB [Chloroflexia bacterium]|nr:hydrogenase nickel incorporation protein HypB [Chloroflexia bacterium]
MSTTRTIALGKRVLDGNDQLAAANRRRLDAAGVRAVNVIASPGAGKTSLIIRTMAALRRPDRVGVIEGDIAGRIDADRVLAAGAAAAIQINTGGSCHLEAGMVAQALDGLDLGALDLLFIENVGNLVCPTHWALGEQLKLCVLSTAEGHDKPVKYPEIFAASDVIVLNKIDLIDLVDFDRAQFYEAVRALNRRAPIFEISCRTGLGVAAWADWLQAGPPAQAAPRPGERAMDTVSHTQGRS